MNVKLRAVNSNDDIEAPKPSIAELKDEIAARLAEIRKMPKNRFAGSYARALDDVNGLIDSYMIKRRLTIVK